MDKYQKPKKDVIKDAGLDTTYGYQIFDGRKKPRRDKLLQLAFGFPLTIEDINTLFRAGGMTVDECNELLYKADEETF